MNIVFLSLGSNLGDKMLNIERAYERIAVQIGPILKKSPPYESPPWGFASEHSFINTAIQLETSLEAVAVLHQIKAIETELGRTEKSTNGQYADRIIDIDILYFNKQIINTHELQIPHPEIAERLFVLVPLNHLDTALIDPLHKKNIGILLAEKLKSD